MVFERTVKLLFLMDSDSEKRDKHREIALWRFFCIFLKYTPNHPVHTAVLAVPLLLTLCFDIVPRRCIGSQTAASMNSRIEGKGCNELLALCVYFLNFS
jgi:hypothetical protein